MSPTDSELEQGKLDKESRPFGEEEERLHNESEEGSIQENRGNHRLQPPLAQTRSHSSARSARSYTDGYTHFEHEEEEKAANGNGQQREEGKEFEVQFDGDSDPWNPKNKATLRKWMIVLIGSSCSLCVTCASALYTSTYNQLEDEFNISREVATVGLTTYVCGLGLGPMFLSPLSEFYGRRSIYICAFGMFFIWLIPCAVAPDIGSMLVFRFIDGLAGSAFLSVAGGTVGDMFPKEKLSAPMMIYTASPFVGPEVGPVIGGFINQYADWRWSFWVLVIWAGILEVCILAFVPETYAPVLLRRKAIKLRKETGDDRWKAPIEIMNRSVAKTVLWSCVRPFQLLFFEQMCLNLCLLSAILLGKNRMKEPTFAIEWLTWKGILYLFFGVSDKACEHNSHDTHPIAGIRAYFPEQPWIQ
jgi:multidrug resistance protein